MRRKRTRENEENELENARGPCRSGLPLALGITRQFGQAAAFNALVRALQRLFLGIAHRFVGMFDVHQFGHVGKMLVFGRKNFDLHAGGIDFDVRGHHPAVTRNHRGFGPARIDAGVAALHILGDETVQFGLDLGTVSDGHGGPGRFAPGLRGR